MQEEGKARRAVDTHLPSESPSIPFAPGRGASFRRAAEDPFSLSRRRRRLLPSVCLLRAEAASAAPGSSAPSPAAARLQLVWLFVTAGEHPEPREERSGAAGRGEGRTSFLPSPSRAYSQPLLTPAGSDVQRAGPASARQLAQRPGKKSLLPRRGLSGFFRGCRTPSLVTFRRNPFRQRATRCSTSLVRHPLHAYRGSRPVLFGKLCSKCLGLHPPRPPSFPRKKKIPSKGKAVT